MVAIFVDCQKCCSKKEPSYVFVTHSPPPPLSQLTPADGLAQTFIFSLSLSFSLPSPLRHFWKTVNLARYTTEAEKVKRAAQENSAHLM